MCSCCRGAAESGDASHHPRHHARARLLRTPLGTTPHLQAPGRATSLGPCPSHPFCVRMGGNVSLMRGARKFDAGCLLPSCPVPQSVSPRRRRSVQTLVDSANYSSQGLCKVPRSRRWCAGWRARLGIGAVTSQLPGVPLDMDLAGRSRGLGRADLMRFNDLPLFQLRHRGSVTRQASLDSRARESGVPAYGWPVSTSSRSPPAQRGRCIRS